MMDLFTEELESAPLSIGPGACWLPGYARAEAAQLLREIDAIAQQAAFRQMQTPGGRLMSCAMTGCGHYSWISDQRGYRYSGKRQRISTCFP